MHIGSRETFIIAIISYLLGKWCTKHTGILKKYNIPEPVTGGVLAAVLFAFVHSLFGIDFDFSLQQRDMLLLVFFTSIGLSSRFATLIKGGLTLLMMIVLAAILVLLQNGVGIATASILDLPKVVGLLGGSISLSGGHGTAIAWASTFTEKFGIQNAAEISLACATFGLILAGVVGGPLAHIMMSKFDIKPYTNKPVLSFGIKHDKENKINITVESIFTTLLVIAVATGLGDIANRFILKAGLKLPAFVTCMFAGVFLTNTIPLIFKKIPWPMNTPALALVSDLSLGLFLTMSLMSLKLYTLVALALPIFVILLIQVALIVLFTYFIVFPLLGRTYETVVICGGFIGLGLGATPTAIANMTAITKKFGNAHRAFIIIPMVGAFFIDVFNAVVIPVILRFL